MIINHGKAIFLTKIFNQFIIAIRHIQCYNNCNCEERSVALMLQSMPLYYLMQVGNYESISIAAEKLHISQPSLSIAIKKLEEELELQLLERTYRGVTLTEDGKKVVALASKAFSFFEEIEQLSSKEKNFSQLQNITIYTNPALIHILTSAFATNSDIDVQIKTIDTSVNISQLLIKSPETIVFAILNEQFTLPNNIGLSILAKSKSYVMCSPNFSYIPIEKNTISFKELTKIPLVVMTPSFEFQDTLIRILKLHGTPNIKSNVNDIFSLTAMCNNGLCAMLGNKLLPTGQQDNTRYIAIRNAPKFVTGLVYNKAISEEIISTLTKYIQPHLI